MSIEPLNPQAEHYLDFAFARLLGDKWPGVREQLTGMGENEVVHFQFRNATISARAGTMLAWLDLHDYEKEKMG